MNIITNNRKRPLLALYELPEDAQKDFEYVLPDDTTYRFVRYSGVWYDTHDCMRVEGYANFKGWHGYASDSYFSGVLFKFVGDDEVIVGRYFT